jgi:hypothetical protein
MHLEVRNSKITLDEESTRIVHEKVFEMAAASNMHVLPETIEINILTETDSEDEHAYEGGSDDMLTSHTAFQQEHRLVWKLLKRAAAKPVGFWKPRFTL